MNTEAITTVMPDLAAVRADDDLLDALGGRDLDLPDLLAGDGLNALLLAWRHATENEPASPFLNRLTRRT